MMSRDDSHWLFYHVPHKHGKSPERANSLVQLGFQGLQKLWALLITFCYVWYMSLVLASLTVWAFLSQSAVCLFILTLCMCALY